MRKVDIKTPNDNITDDPYDWKKACFPSPVCKRDWSEDRGFFYQDPHPSLPMLPLSGVLAWDMKVLSNEALDSIIKSMLEYYYFANWVEHWLLPNIDAGDIGDNPNRGDRLNVFLGWFVTLHLWYKGEFYHEQIGDYERFRSDDHRKMTSRQRIKGREHRTRRISKGKSPALRNLEKRVGGI